MNSDLLKNAIQSLDRHKLICLKCQIIQLDDCIKFINSLNINVFNIGKEVSLFISALEDHSKLNLEVFDFVTTLLEKSKATLLGLKLPVVAIYNIGILLEPSLNINVSQLLKDFSRTSALILVWEGEIDHSDHLYWSPQQNTKFIDFSDIRINKLQYAI
jgi:hypothetical protein